MSASWARGGAAPSAAARSSAASSSLRDAIGDRQDDAAALANEKEHRAGCEDDGHGRDAAGDEPAAPDRELRHRHCRAVRAHRPPERHVGVHVHLVARRDAGCLAPHEDVAAPTTHVIAPALLLDRRPTPRTTLHVRALRRRHERSGSRRVHGGAGLALGVVAQRQRHRLQVLGYLLPLQRAEALRALRAPALRELDARICGDAGPAEGVAASQRLHRLRRLARAEADRALVPRGPGGRARGLDLAVGAQRGRRGERCGKARHRLGRRVAEGLRRRH
mmetsp:Transcript_56474/g.158430  ORF Transcript_56474/g.158430 Transcript_56474/m.158430 type:complete len:277 (-) Transcript_56474:185-1015(-)